MENIIKFRMLLGENIVGYCQFMNQGIKPNGNWMYSIDGNRTWDFKSKYAFTKLEQYTGMNDINDREIYVNDQVQFENSDGNVGGAGYIAYMPETASYIVDTWKEGDKTSNGYNLGECKNIRILGHVFAKQNIGL